MADQAQTPLPTPEQQQERQANMPTARARRQYTFNTPPGNRQHLRNPVVESPPSPSRKWTKLAVRNRGKISNAPEASITDRRTLLPNKITYATDASWMANILEGTQETNPVEDVQISIKWASKLVYFMQHKISNEDICAILTAYGFLQTHHHDYIKMARSLNRDRSRYQNEILTNFIFPKVGFLMGEWAHQDANAEKKFEDLEPRDRFAVWYAYYDMAPAEVCKRFWSPVQAVIDWAQVFNVDASLPEVDKIKLKGVRNMLRHKFLFACEETFCLRYLEATPEEPNAVEDVQVDGATQLFSNWRGYSAAFADKMVGLDNVPVQSPGPVTKTTPGHRRTANTGNRIDFAQYMNTLDDESPF